MIFQREMTIKIITAICPRHNLQEQITTIDIWLLSWSVPKQVAVFYPLASLPKLSRLLPRQLFQSEPAFQFLVFLWKDLSTVTDLATFQSTWLVYHVLYHIFFVIVLIRVILCRIGIYNYLMYSISWLLVLTR